MSVFGGSAGKHPTPQSVFGSKAPTSSQSVLGNQARGSIFGGNQTNTTTTPRSLFEKRNPAPAPPTASSVFGNASTTLPFQKAPENARSFFQAASKTRSDSSNSGQIMSTSQYASNIFSRHASTDAASIFKTAGSDPRSVFGNSTNIEKRVTKLQPVTTDTPSATHFGKKTLFGKSVATTEVPLPDRFFSTELELSAHELEQFKADRFEYIPMNLPPKCLCV